MVEEGHEGSLSDGNDTAESGEQTQVNRRTKPDVIQLEVGTVLKMYVGYEKMYETGVGEEVKSRLITTPVEIIVMDGATGVLANLGLLICILVIGQV